MNNDEQRSEAERRIASEARGWIVRLSSGAVSDAELHQFKAWREQSSDHVRIFAKERAFWRGLEGLEGRDVRMDRSMSGLTRRALIAGTMAAAAAGVVVWTRSDILWRADHRTAIGEQAAVTLPDGSSALLNTDSALALDFAQGRRRITLLQGEVQFSVSPVGDDIPFSVMALGGESWATDATYAVGLFGDRATVTAVTGQVRVASGPSHEESHQIQIDAGQQSSYLSGAAPVPVVPVDTEAALAWRTGQIVLDGMPFAKAIDDIGRYLPERIVVTAVGHDRNPVSGIFSVNQPFEAISALAETQGLSVRRVRGVVILVS
jgi:transmembrane sensor